MDVAARKRLATFLAEKLPDRDVASLSLTRLAGGSIQESWRIDTADAPLVLRADGQTTIPASHGRAQEFALLSAARQAGVACPTPLLLEATGAIIGRPFFLMTLEAGSADPYGITAIDDGTALAQSLARELATLHRIRPGHPGLDFLPIPGSCTNAALALYRDWLDRRAEPQPVLEWALRRLSHIRPADLPPVLCHRDFRTGNYLVAGGALSALLDWEFAGWSDPREDLGWFCATSWRFGRPDRVAGGLAARADFLGPYEEAAGIIVDPAGLRWWEAMAVLRWALIALHQVDRMLLGGERSLDLALTGRRLVECEAELLRLLGTPAHG